MRAPTHAIRTIKRLVNTMEIYVICAGEADEGHTPIGAFNTLELAKARAEEHASDSGGGVQEWQTSDDADRHALDGHGAKKFWRTHSRQSELDIYVIYLYEISEWRQLGRASTDG